MLELIIVIACMAIGLGMICWAMTSFHQYEWLKGIIGIVMLLGAFVHIVKRASEDKNTACHQAMRMARTSSDSLAVFMRCNIPQYNNHRTTVVPIPVYTR